LDITLDIDLLDEARRRIQKSGKRKTIKEKYYKRLQVIDDRKGRSNHVEVFSKVEPLVGM